MKLALRKNPVLPRLSWLLNLPTSGSVANVVHGADVETAENWIIEGAWDGAFTDGDFHRTFCIFGSGIRIADDALYLVTSTALTDCLYLWQSEHAYTVSNSLSLLLAQTGCRLDSEFDYLDQLNSILKGTDRYDPALHVEGHDAQSIQRLYHHNYRIKDGVLSQEPKPPSPAGVLDGFDSYYAALRSRLTAVIANGSDAARKCPMISASTMSSGYDSTAASALAYAVGTRDFYTVAEANSIRPAWMGGQTSDHGHGAAKGMGIALKEVGEVPRDVDERYYVAAGALVVEARFYPMAKEIEASKAPVLLFTGYNGDHSWTRLTDTSVYEGGVTRQDISGQSLSEVRLHAGYINLCVPFLFADQPLEIHRLSNSEEMQPWSVGGSYDRPIPRRIAEEAGASRDSFGQEKKAVSNMYYLPQNRQCRAEFYRYLKRRGSHALFMHAERLFSIARYMLLRALGKKALRGSQRQRNDLFVWSANTNAEQFSQWLTKDTA